MCAALLHRPTVAFGYGRLGVLQQKLLTSSDIDRLLGSHTPAEFERTLTEIPFTDPVPNCNSHTVIGEMEAWLRSEMNALVPPPHNNAFHTLWIKEDGARISLLLKKYFNLVSDSLEEEASLEHSPLGQLILHGKRSDVSEELFDFVHAMKNRETSPTAQEIDSAVAHFVAEEQIRFAKKSGSKLILKYIEHGIDLQNVRTLQRIPDDEDATPHLLAGGSVHFSAYMHSESDLAAALMEAGFSPEIHKTFSGNSSLQLERAISKAVAKDVIAMRDLPLSLEALFAFAILVLSQLKLLRTIIIGKHAGLSAMEIRDMLPPFLSTSPYGS